MRRWLKAEDCWAHLGRAFQSIILFPRKQADHDVCRTISRPGRTCWNSLRCSTSLPAPESPDAKQNQEANVFTWNSRLVWQFGEILLGGAADHWWLITWTGHIWPFAWPFSFLEFISRDVHQVRGLQLHLTASDAGQHRRSQKRFMLFQFLESFCIFYVLEEACLTCQCLWE